METIFFWIPWLLISFIILRTFYFKYKASYVMALRRVALGVNILALILFFSPWIPGTEETGWNIVTEKNSWAMAVFVLLAGSTFLLLASRPLFLKIGAVSQTVTGIFFIAAMTQIIPGTVAISLKYVAPIVASLLLLANIVVVFTLWRQLELQASKIGVK